MFNLGLLLAFATAIATALQNIYQKESVVETDEWVASWSKRTFAVIGLAPAVLISGIPDINLAKFLPVLVLNTAISVIATILISKAYKREEVSFLAPLSALSPIPMLITSPLIVGEWPSPIGLIGVLVVVSGVYLLKAEDTTTLTEPIRKIASNRAAQMMIFVTLLYSISSNYDKVGVLLSDPIFWAFIYTGTTALALTPIMMVKTDDWTEEIKTGGKSLFVFGLISGIGSVFQMFALEHTLVIYVTTIKRLSIPLSVILAYILYNETNIRGRTIGSLLAMAGAVLITLA